MAMASFAHLGEDQEQEAEEAGCGTPRCTPLKAPAQDDAKLEEAFGGLLAGAVEAMRKEQQEHMEALRQELQAQQQACTASLEERFSQRAAEEREELNSVLTDWYAQSTQVQQEQGEAIEQLRCQAASDARPGAGASDAPDSGAGKAAAAAQEAVQALREELLALRAEDMLALQEAITGLSEEMSKVLQSERGGKGAAGGEDQGAMLERLESLEVACTEMAGLSQQHHDLIHEVKSSSDQAQMDLGRLAADRATPQGGCSSEEAQALSERLAAAEEALAGISEEMSKALQGDRGCKSAAGGEDQGAILERLESLELSCTEMAGLSQQHHDLIYEVKSSSDQAQADLGRLAEERAAPQGGCSAEEAQAAQGAILERLESLEAACTEMAGLSQQHDDLIHEVKSSSDQAQADLGRLAAERAVPQGGCSGEEAKALSENVTLLAVRPVLERLAAVEDGLAALRPQPAEARSDTEALVAALEEVRARAEGDVSQLAQEVELSEAAIREARALADRAQGDVGNLAEEVAALSLRLQARDVEDGQAMVGSGVSESDREQVKAWTMEAVHQASGHLSQRVRDLEDGLPGLKSTVAEALAKQIAGLEGSIFDRAKQEQASATKEQASRDVSEELLRRVQTQLQTLEDSGLGQGAAVTAERAKKLAAEVMQDLSQELQAMHKGEMTLVLTAVEELRSQVTDASIALDLQAATSTAIEELSVRVQALEGQEFAQRAEGLEGSCDGASPSRRGEDPSQMDDLSVAGSPAPAANDALPPPPRTSLSASQVARALAPTLRAGAHGEASEQQPALRERLQGLVDMVKGAARYPEGGPGAGEARSSAPEARPVASAPGRSASALEGWSPVTGMLSFVASTSCMNSFVAPSGMETFKGAAIRASSPRCGPSGSPRPAGVPGMARVAAGSLGASQPPRRSPSANGRASMYPQPAARAQSPVRRVVLGSSQVTDAAPVMLLRSPASHSAASHSQLVVAQAPPAPISAWASGVAPAGGSVRIQAPQLFAHQAGRA